MPQRTPLLLCYAAVRLALGWLMLMLCQQSACAQDPPLENAVKATYLHKFAPFVDWPSPAAEFPNGDFTVCVVGDDPFGNLLDRAASGQTIAGRPIVVRRFASIRGNPGCSVLLATGSNAQSVPEILAALKGAPVLTVTDNATNPAAVGIINFVLVDNRVRFEIDNRAALANGLTISSKLLNLAVHVNGDSR